MDKQYTQLADFLDDPNFRNWVLGHSPEAEAGWNQWLAENPEKRQLVQEAASIVVGIPARPFTIDPHIKKNLWERIDDRIDQDVIPSPKRYRVLIRTVSIAASIILIAAIALLFTWYNPNSHILAETGYGETKELVLPDSSRLILNAHSNVKYPASWPKEGPREIWLEGEAYFSVNHLANDQPFWVYSGDVLVKVLGTSFNMRQRSGKAEVVLEEGLVELSHRTKGETIRLEPGQSATFDYEKGSFKAENINTEIKTAWRKQLLVFDETPIEEIAYRIEEIYGIPVKVEGDSLLQRKLTGRVNSADLDVLLNALSLSFQIEIDLAQDTLLMKAKP